MRHFDARNQGTCSVACHFDLSDDGTTVHNVSFNGGCNGNLKAIGSLVEGREVDEVVSLLEGNTCGPRQTSCADQLARNLAAAKAEVLGE
jgi:uncharacterized protein (TIGR03905 family)